MIDFKMAVNPGAYMNFKEATDGLFERVDHEDLARALGVSVAAIRQARLRPDAAAHRPPPKDWRSAVIRLAEQRASRYLQLSAQLRDSPREPVMMSAAALRKLLML